MQLLRYLATVFGFMLEKFQMDRKRLEQEQVAQELRLQTSRSELKALRAQINPHFLFNALNAIASLIHTDPGARRRGRRAARRGVPLHAAAIRLRVGAARSGTGLRAGVSRRRTGAVRPAADLLHRLRSPRRRSLRAVDDAADPDRKRDQARRVADARTRANRRDRPHHQRSTHGRGARYGAR